MFGFSISAAHVIVQFTQALLAKELRACEELQNSAAVKGAFIFVCRQMYHTCEGLQVLRPYSLHECIAQAWRKVTSLVLTHTTVRLAREQISFVGYLSRQVTLHSTFYTATVVHIKVYNQIKV